MDVGAKAMLSKYTGNATPSGFRLVAKSQKCKNLIIWRNGLKHRVGLNKVKYEMLNVYNDCQLCQFRVSWVADLQAKKLRPE